MKASPQIIGRIILKPEIIDGVWKKFTERKPTEKRSISCLREDLIKYIKEKNGTDIGNNFSENIINPFFDPKTVSSALNKGNKQNDFGAEAPLRNLLCYYAHESDYITVLKEKFNSTEEVEKKETDRIKGRTQNTEPESKSQSTDKPSDISTEDDKIYTPLWKKIAIPFLVVVLLLVLLFALFNKDQTHKTESTRSNRKEKHGITHFDTSKGSYNILFFPFQPLEKCQFKKTDIESTIITRLNDMSYTDNLNLQVIYDTIDCIRTYVEADSIGKKFNANLVIWGDLYEHCSSDNKEACLKFINISSQNFIPGIKNKGESGIENMASLSEVREGKLQKDIDYIIYWVAASRAFSKEDYTIALKHFKKIENFDNATYELFFNIATCNYYLHHLDDVKKYLEKVLEMNPNYSPAISNYVILLDKENAKKYFEKCIKKYPNNISLLNNYANFLQDKNFNDKESAKAQYAKALSINPSNAILHNSYANFLQDNNDTANAKKHYKQALRLNPNFAVAHFNYALLLVKKFNNREDAKEHFEEALNIDPSNAIFHNSYAYFLQDKFNDTENAKKHYLEAIRLDSTFKNKEEDSYFGIK